MVKILCVRVGEVKKLKAEREGNGLEVVFG